MLREIIDSKKGHQADQSLTASEDAFLPSVICILLYYSAWHFHEFEFSLCGDIPIQFNWNNSRITNPQRKKLLHFSFLPNSLLELKWNRSAGAWRTLFGVFRFSFPFWKEKNKKNEPETVENTAEFRIWNNLEFLDFVFSKIWSFYLWCIKSQSIPSDLDRLSKINFSFSLNVPFQCSVSGILYGKNRKIPITAIQK